MKMTKEEEEIFYATKAGPVQAHAILNSLKTWEGITPEAIYEKGKRMYDMLKISRADAMTGIKIDLINSAGGGNGRLPDEVPPVTKLEFSQHYTKQAPAVNENARAIYEKMGLSESDIKECLADMPAGIRQLETSQTHTTHRQAPAGNEAAISMYRKLGLSESDIQDILKEA